MSLYHKYRPVSFSEIIGNEATVEVVQNKIENEDCPHAILLHGPRGCGKTTIARLISSAIKCKITSGDFIELDAVQCGNIDVARQIRQNMHYLPFEPGSKCRVWLIDEAHGSSPKFQEGLLKALEDTPSHVYFILCTTELSKIIPTVRSRCTHYEVKLLKDDQIKELLEWVLKEEECDIAKEVIEEIIESCLGSPREALVTLDKVIDLDSTGKMLDAIGETELKKEVRELCQAMLKNASWKKISEILKGLKSSEPEKIRRAVIGYMSAVLLNGEDAKAALILDCFSVSIFQTGFPGIVLAAFQTLD